MSPARSVILILALTAAAGFGWLLVTAGQRGTPPAALQEATVLPEPRVLEPFTLRDQRGQPLTQATLEGAWHLLFFGFANCPDICPLTLQQLATARRELLSQGGSDSLRILFVSVDPERDTPELLNEYAAQFGAGVLAATADPAALRELADDLGIFFQVQAGDAADYAVSHSSAVLLLNPRGELQAVFSAPHSVAAFVNDLPLLMAGGLPGPVAGE